MKKVLHCAFNKGYFINLRLPLNQNEDTPKEQVIYAM